jgi:hypothetical protein
VPGRSLGDIACPLFGTPWLLLCRGTTAHAAEIDAIMKWPKDAVLGVQTDLSSLTTVNALFACGR